MEKKELLLRTGLSVDEKFGLIYKHLSAFVAPLRIEQLNQIQLLYKNTLLQNPETEFELQRALDAALICSLEIGMRSTATFSTLLYAPFSLGIISAEDIEKHYYARIMSVINSLEEINKLDTARVFGIENAFSERSAQLTSKLTKREKKYARPEKVYLVEQAENFRKMMLTLADDVRVVLVQTSLKLNALRNAKTVSDNARMTLAREAYYIYAPMAHRLGLYHIKTEMEELGMKHMEPDMYKFIAGKLEETKDDRERYISSFIEPIKEELSKRNIHCEIKGRPKSIHSIYNKIAKQEVTFEGIYDLFAIRIILDDEYPDLKDEKAACWQVYSMITDVWEPNPRRLRDWISAPKDSGYESLHTTVIGPEGKWVEVQIRTRRMDDIAEKGDAAHWKYKEVKGDDSNSNWMDQLRSVLENPHLHEDEEKNEAKAELYSDTIFVFTPKGELIKLSKGATVLDFAYAIHSSVGEQCVGAKANGKLVAIKDVLLNGDRVEVLLSKKQKPKPEWLEIVISTKAKNRIKHFLKTEENKHAEEGKVFVKQKFEELRGKYPMVKEEFSDKTVSKLMDYFKIEAYIDFYNAVGNNRIALTEASMYDVFVAPAKQEYNAVLEKLTSMQDEVVTRKSGDFLVIDNHTSGIEFELAKCCNPIPGDSIFGFVSVYKGTKIHKTSCPNAQDMISRFPYRLVKAKWQNDAADRQFLATFYLSGNDSIGLVSDITNVISKGVRVNMQSININSDRKGWFEGEITVYVNGTVHLTSVMDALRSVKGIVEVKRVDKKMNKK